MCGYGTLDKDSAERGVKASSEKIESYFPDVIFDPTWVGIISRERVKIRDEEIALVLVLELYPVIESSHVVAEVKPAGGSHAAEHAGALCDEVFLCHSSQV